MSNSGQGQVKIIVNRTDGIFCKFKLSRKSRCLFIVPDCKSMMYGDFRRLWGDYCDLVTKLGYRVCAAISVSAHMCPP
jgi:hypothetical protein